MQVTEQIEGNILIFNVEGRLDNKGSDIFRGHIMTRIADGHTRLIVDFTKTSFIASMGIRALFIPAQELARVGGRLVLSGLNKEIKSVFQIGGILDLFTAYDTSKHALRDEKWGKG